MSCIEKEYFYELLSFSGRSKELSGFNPGSTQTLLQHACFSGRQNMGRSTISAGRERAPVPHARTSPPPLPSSLPDHLCSLCIFIFNEVRSIKVVK